MPISKKYQATIKSYKQDGDFFVFVVDFKDTVSLVKELGVEVKVPLNELTGDITEDSPRLKQLLQQVGFAKLSQANAKKANQDRIALLKTEADSAINKNLVFYEEEADAKSV